MQSAVLKYRKKYDSPEKLQSMREFMMKLQALSERYKTPLLGEVPPVLRF